MNGRRSRYIGDAPFAILAGFDRGRAHIFTGNAFAPRIFVHFIPLASGVFLFPPKDHFLPNLE